MYEPLLTSRVYDPELKVPATKAGITAGMSMTEKQGGSDVRAGTSQAVPNGDGSYTLTGHKWFTSAAMSDIYLVLAQAPGGLSCFFLPKVLPDGTRNRMFIQRLKDKLGNHANASSEIEYDGATVWLVGEEGRGVPTIIEMVNMTRLDCTLGSATSMRQGLAMAMHHIQHRKAFGAYLIDQPLMRNVIADLAVEAEAATIVAMRMAGAADAATRGDERETMLRRIGLAAAKYWVCKRATPHAAEAMECLGGNGYAEDSGMPRLYREAPLMGIWEGSGNVSALDTLRAMATRPDCVEVCVRRTGHHRGAGRPTRRPYRAVAGGPGPADAGIPCPQNRRRHQPGTAGLAAGAPRTPRCHRCVPGQQAGRGLGRRVRHPAQRVGPRPDHRARPGEGVSAEPERRRDKQSSGKPSWNASLCLRAGAREGAGEAGERRSDHDDLRGHRSSRTHHLQSAREGQRDRRRDPVGTCGLRGTCRPDPNVHVILVSGRGEGFCAGFDLSAYADGSGRPGEKTARARCSTATPRPSTTCRTSRGIR